MNDNKKIISLDDDNKLVIKDDNAVTTIKDTTSKIEGVYEISDEDVKKLLVLINDKTILKKGISYSFIEKKYISDNKILTNDEAVSNVLKEYDELMEKYTELRKEYNELTKECNELNTEYYELRNRHMTMKENFDNLVEKVKKHNKNRLFNKIKIEGGEQ